MSGGFVEGAGNSCVSAAAGRLQADRWTLAAVAGRLSSPPFASGLTTLTIGAEGSASGSDTAVAT